MDPTLTQVLGGALGLNRSAFEAIEVAPNGLRLALLVLLLAGISETLGQSVVLVLNRVSRPRFFLSLGLGGLELALEVLVWMVSVFLLAIVLGVQRPSFGSAARVIALAYAPLVLGFLVFLPYLGPLIGRLLRLWVLLATVVGASVAFDVAPLGAAIAAFVGFLGRWALFRAFALATEARG
jgi:hypothetical protein